MTTLVQIWREKRDFFNEKSFAQIISISGKGELKDGNETSCQVRELLDEIPSKNLIQYGSQCLEIPFKDSGLALQDVINQYGKRLGFHVQPGLYKGKRNEIGYDGIWTIPNEHTFIVEIKTTDAYRINLDTISQYKEKLTAAGKVNKENVSILLVVGREDTGDLEAQIRGSKHAWSIRILSISALTRLLELRETVDDLSVLKKINEILKPQEYTRLDKLIELIFDTSQDVQQESEESIVTDDTINEGIKTGKSAPVDFHEACINRLSIHFGKTFIQQSRSTYTSSDNQTGLTCAVSKIYFTKNNEIYWYAFHPHQENFLKDYENAFVSFGCGNENNIILFPAEIFIELLPLMGTTKLEKRHYWHVKIHKRDKKFFIETPGSTQDKRKDITAFLLK